MAGNLYEQGYYETGTASIEQGQKVVTGQGTAWSQIVRPADDFGKHVGMPIPIASVDSDTQITLAYPWPGPTQAAAPYRVTFTPYHVAYRQALQEIGQLLESGNVSALAGLSLTAGDYLRATGSGAMEAVDGGNLDALAALVGASGKFPVFDGAGSMILENLSDYAGTGDVNGPAGAADDNVALFDGTTGKLVKDGFPVSAFARTLLGDADAAAARSTLNVGILSGFRNKIINGDFDVWQRGTSFSVAGFTADRWQFGHDGNGSGRAGTISRQVDEATNNLIGSDGAYHLQWSEDTPGTGYGFKLVEQKIEGVRSLAGRKVTLTFWACMPVGGGVNLLTQLRQNFGTGGSPLIDYPHSFFMENDGIWRKYTTTFDLLPAVGKTIGDGNCLSVLFFLPTNTPFLFGLKRVSLVEGDATAEADPFSPRHIQQELNLCQRYYERGGGLFNDTDYATFEYKTMKRTVPSVVTTPAHGQAGTYSHDPQTNYVVITSASGQSAVGVEFTADAEL